MIDFLKLIESEFKSICNKSYLQVNASNKIVYPYVTYDFDSESIEYGMDGFYIDIDIFDRGKSLAPIMQLEEQFKKHFLMFRELSPELFVRFEFLRSIKVPTGEKSLRRRNLQFYCRVDWRKINE